MKGLANVGDILAGKYKVERILGIGGMGMVVLATHMELEQQVAIKFMLPSALESKDAVDRFMREARAAGRLTSEHVCRVSDVGKFDSGVPYIVMEYLDGFDLGTLLKRKGAMQVAQAADFIIQAAEGMAEAHGHGIVHRDLKPDNLFLHNRTDGSQIVKVLDFGISKAATGLATKTGDIMGSPAYMAPEQMQSTKDVDPRADIWSLGVILYQLISGRLPFIADTLPALCLSVINDAPPSLESIRRDLPHGLAQVVMKCLAKRKEERFRNVHELAQSLAPYGKPESMSAITRIRGMLQRKRPPTPPPLMMLPSEFSDIAPTLVGNEQIPSGTDSAASSAMIEVASGTGRDMMEKATQTTIGSGSAESMSLSSPRKPMNKGLIGALVGSIAMVVLIIVMVLVRRGGENDTTNQPAANPPPPPPPVTEPVETVKPPPPIDEPKPPVVENAGSSVEVIEEPPVLDTNKPTAKKDRKKRDKKVDPKDPKTGSGSAASPPPPAPPDEEEEDKWGHMHHDKKDEKKDDKKDAPKPEAP